MFRACLPLILFSWLCVNNSYAQSPANHAWISTGKVSARITSTGIHPDNEGGFLLGTGIPGAPSLNLLSHLVPWVGGTDPAGNLKLACEMDDPALSDWAPGFRGIPNSDKVWKVTREQIEEHIADFQDNGVVDNPIQAIFAWPAFGNPYSLQFNGFETGSSTAFLVSSAPYYDFVVDGIYNPADGDFPYGIGTGSLELYPEQIVFAPFHDSGLNELTNSTAFEMNGNLIVTVFDCNALDFTKNTIFFDYNFHLISVSPAISTYLGFFADFDLGDPNDDYLGCNTPPSGKIFSYNSDTLNDAIAGLNPPAVSIVSILDPLDGFGDTKDLSHLMPMYGNNFPPGTRRPQLPIEFYRYLSGQWRDSSPLRTGGIGYQTSGSLSDFAFPGHPSKTNEWSEMTSQNPLGERECVFSYGPIKHWPNTVNRVLFAVTVSEKNGPSDQLAQFEDFYQKYLNMYNWSPDIPNPLDSTCFKPVFINQPVEENSISIFPNPAYSQITLLSTNPAYEIEIFDVFGKRVIEMQRYISEKQEVSIPVSHLPAGIYFLKWSLKNGEYKSCKIVIGKE